MMRFAGFLTRFLILILASQVVLHAENSPVFKGRVVTLGDFGSEDLGYLSLPEVAPIGGIVVIHDQWGLNDHVKEVTDSLAKAGYVSLAVDLFNGRVVTDPSEAKQLVANLRQDAALKTIQAGVKLLKESPKLKVPKVGTIGWSRGGNLSLLAALQIKGVDASVIYYGVPLETDDKRIAKLNVPICAIFADKTDASSEFETLMKSMNKPLESHHFNLKRGFDNPASEQYSEENAKKAWKLMTDFLSVEFTKPPPPPGLLKKIGNFFE
jgi:carboxymethylenebutenolidase